MTYRQDPIYRTVQWLRDTSHPTQPSSFAARYAEVWRAWAQLECQHVKVQVGLINYKPFERARVVADVTFVPGRRHGSSPVRLNLLLHIFAEPDAAHREIESRAKEDLLCCYGPPTFHFESRRLVAWTLPNAPNLRELGELLDPERFRHRFLSRLPGVGAGACSAPGPTLVRYVPLKRALLSWHCPTGGQHYYIKLIGGPAAASAALNLREVDAWAASGALDLAVPKPVYYSPHLRTVVMSKVPGRSFTRIMMEGCPEPFADVGRALASLHRLKATPMTVWSADRELGHLRRHMDGVKRALPGLSGRLDGLVSGLEARRVAPVQDPVPIHGNLFGDQILYDSSASRRRVGIVDWDDWSLGDRHFDLGRLLAHFLYVARLAKLPDRSISVCGKALLRGYDAAGGGAVDCMTLDWHVIAALLLRAKISSLRKLRPGWPKHVELMVTEAEHILNGGNRARPKAWPTARSRKSLELAA